MAKKITTYLKQSGNDLVVLRDCILTIDMSNYDSENMRKEEKIWVKSLLGKAEFGDLIFDIVLDYPVDLFIYKLEKVGKEYLKLYYTANSIMLSVSTEAAESKVQISYVDRLIGGKEILKDAAHLYRKLFAVYGKLSDMDSVHLEILCSQVLRDKTNVHIPARLSKKWDPTLVNLKKVVFSEGFINGLAFENVNEAIKTGLISEERGELSIIEKVMTGTLVDEGRGRKSMVGTSQYQNR